MKERKRLSSRVSSLFLALVFLVTTVLVSGFEAPVFAALGNVTSATLSGDILTISIGTDKYIIQVCKPDILKADYLPAGVLSPDTQVIGNTSWPAGNIISSDTNSNPMVIKTSKMTVKINKTPCRVSVYDASGTNLYIKENDTEGVYNDGVKFTHNSGDNYYGISGFNATEGSTAGILRNSGNAVKAGDQGNCGAPFVWSTKGYGVLIDSEDGNFGITSTDLTFSGCSKTDIEYYVVVGKPSDIMTEVGQISGYAPMYPKWAMGFTNTEWGIDETELVNTVNTYRSKNIPIDNYCLDFDWKAWGEDNYGEWRWNGTKFPDGPTGNLKTMMDAKGIKLTGIMKPRILVNSVQGNYATSNGYWWPGKSPYNDYMSGKQVNDLNFDIAGCRTWLFDHFKDSLDKGIAGYWNDEEDSGFSSFEGFNMQKALYEGQRAYKNQRVWSINRNFYLGAQRYAYGLWSGDINTGFASMANQRERMLSAIDLGETKWGMDSGGFNGTPSSENYARWIQFSAFVPIFRVHGTNNEQRQPWVYGTQAESAAKSAIQLRYKLIPYIYSYDRRANETGVGLVKPLVFDYPQDSNVANYKDAWMFGDYLLVSPVVDQGQTVKSIYLPAGTWTDYFRGDTYNGGQTINYSVNASTWEDIPLFIKKGAIIPSQDFQNYVGEKPVTSVYVDVFPDSAATSFKYYDDDGTTYNYENGAYFAQDITAQDNTTNVGINIGARQGTFTPDLQYYIYKVHGWTGTYIASNGSSITNYSSYTNLINASGEGWASGQDVYGNVVYIKIAAGSAKNIVLTGSKGGATPTPTPTATSTPSATPTATPVPGGQPDLVVTDITWSPANYAAGNAVTFSATIKNQGTGATTAGVINGVSFSVDGTQVSWSDNNTSSIAAGTSITVTANGGPSGAAWIAATGNHTVMAWVDDVNRIAESNESNNQFSKALAPGSASTPTPTPTATPSPTPTPTGSTATPTPTPGSTATPTPTPLPANLALGKSITCNSYTQSYVATNANDGNTSTYWEGGANSYPNILTVDMGSSQAISKVVLKLNSSWGTRTQTLSVQGSNDNNTYINLASSTTYTFDPATGNNVTITFTSTSQRYVRLNFTANSGATGGQTAEFEVYR